MIGSCVRVLKRACLEAYEFTKFEMDKKRLLHGIRAMGYSAFMLAVLTTAAHLSISARMKAPNSCGVPGAGSAARLIGHAPGVLRIARR